VLRVGGGTVVIDYAHNEIGLTQLLGLARSLTGPGGRVIAVVGSAGDRDDGTIRGLGRVAGELADIVLLKGTEKYLRGRANAAEILALLAAGVAAGGSQPAATAPSEMAAIDLALDTMHPGDAVAVMSFEDAAAARARVEARGGQPSLTPRPAPAAAGEGGTAAPP
jgi:cyanophycin synthetase